MKPKKRLYQFLAVLFLALWVFALTIPIFDYTKRESLAYIKQPTQQNLDALEAKRREEWRAHWLYASPFVFLGVVFAILALSKYKREK